MYMYKSTRPGLQDIVRILTLNCSCVPCSPSHNGTLCDDDVHNGTCCHMVCVLGAMMYSVLCNYVTRCSGKRKRHRGAHSRGGRRGRGTNSSSSSSSSGGSVVTPEQQWRLTALGEIQSNLTDSAAHNMCLDGAHRWRGPVHLRQLVRADKRCNRAALELGHKRPPRRPDPARCQIRRCTA